MPLSPQQVACALSRGKGSPTHTVELVRGVGWCEASKQDQGSAASTFAR